MMSDIQDGAERRKEDREHSVINLMINETKKRLKDLDQSKESILEEEEEEKTLLFKIEYLNNLLINKNNKIIIYVIL